MSGNESALREEIVLHRQELADTVDALAAKLDVKSQAKAKATELTAELKPYAVPAAGVLAALVALLVWRRRSS